MRCAGVCVCLWVHLKSNINDHLSRRLRARVVFGSRRRRSRCEKPLSGRFISVSRAKSRTATAIPVKASDTFALVVYKVGYASSSLRAIII